ncbi:UDP-glucuronate 4-epimerase 6 [Brachypodium distachyon]|uniref:NAD-dependent epimerase/dehydratase domain-containing protein n=1 Tax=Brachypodium distachyon TaxID=15368 RepID=I1I8T7_BRADI|nr:UDP-glucuronate 4-epimerase 6 [Brachypodium distachyon]KQJ99081.1 hypothetical protein BRADI_3g40930v3 [Brachypodium distachyon]|eukprot:XP_003572425.1 UDP-glucuronate 4-epimerase 6 [Brachypodium distachyon]
MPQSSSSLDAAAKGRHAHAPSPFFSRGRAGTGSKLVSASSHLLFRATVLATIALVCLFAAHYPSLLSHSFRLSSPTSSPHRSLLGSSSSSSSSSSAPAFGTAAWDRAVRRSATPRRANGMSVLVTGAAGFVGFHCAMALAARGDGVVGLDNFNAYYDVSLKRSRQRLLAESSHGHAGVLVLAGDINDAALLRRLLSGSGAAFTHVLHLAAQAGVRHALRDPQSYVASNVAGLVNLLESVAAVSNSSRPAVVWASSSSVYGLNDNGSNGGRPFSEEDRTDRPASLYAATKKAGEAIAHAYSSVHGLSVTGLRFFTVYGPWGRPDMAYFAFARAIVAGDPVTLYAGATRDFTFIDDVVRGCLAALDAAKKKKLNRVYNIGNTEPVPVARMVAVLEKLLGKKARKRVVAMPRNGDVLFTHANVSLAARDLGYRPTTPLDAGLRRFVDWFLRYYKIDNGAAAGGKQQPPAKRKKSAMSAAA